MKAPASFEGFVRKIFNNDDELSLNIAYINKNRAQNTQFSNSSLVGYFNCTTAEQFRILYDKEIAGDKKFCISIGTDTHNVHIYSYYMGSYYNFLPCRYDILLVTLRNFSRQFMPKKKIEKTVENIIQDDKIINRFKIMEIE
jgi:hypothetical protein